MTNFIDKINHIFSRIKTYKNWYVLIWPMTRLLTKSRIIRVRNGCKIFARNIFGPDFVVIHEMFYRDDYCLRLLREKHGTNDNKIVILDAGANIGAFSILAEKLFKNAIILAYEPEKSNARILSDNIKLNGIQDKVFVYEQALTANEGEQNLFLSKQEYAHSMIKSQVEESFLGSVKVSCVNIYGIMKKRNLNRVNIFKLDIEGEEYEVFYGFSEEIFKKINYILFELHDRKNYSKDELLNFLKKNGFGISQSPTNQKVYIAENIYNNF